MKEQDTVKIALVDDHTIVRNGFKSLLETVPYFKVIGEASNKKDANLLLEQKGKELDVLIVDISLPDCSGIEIIRCASEQYPKLKTIVLSMYAHNPYIDNALKSGVWAYLSKRSASEDLLEAIVSVMSGNSFLSKDVLNNLRVEEKQTRSARSLDVLTNREREIFPFLAKGLNAKQISKQLNIMPKTAHAHRTNIFNKLNTQDQMELLRIGIAAGNVSIDDLV